MQRRSSISAGSVAIIGNPVFGSSLGCSGGSSWSPSKVLGGETPTKRFISRSGLNLIDSLGGDPIPIQLPYFYKNAGNESLYVADNGALDIANNLGQNGGVGDYGYTIAIWVKGAVATNASAAYIAGKNVAGGVNGRNGFDYGTNSKYDFSLQSSGGYVNRESTVLITDQLWHFLLGDINITTHKARFFIDKIQIGADVDFTGTFSQMSNAYETYIGAGNAAAGAGISAVSRIAVSDTYIYPFILTTSQHEALFNRQVVLGAKAHWDCVLKADNVCLDLSGNGYHLTGTNSLIETKKKYSDAGSRQGLELGYTRYVDFPNKDIFVPYTDSGDELTGYTPAGYTKDANYTGGAAFYNLCESYIAVPGLDRSSVTTCTYLARSTSIQNYYDSLNVSYVHANELSNYNLSNLFNDDYRGLLFTKITNRVLTDFYTYATNKTGVDYEKPIKYSGETNLLKFDVITAPHNCAVSGSKVLKFDDVHTLSLSLDSGATYPITLLTTLSHIDDAFFYDNGNIGFSDNTKCYYSDDNLATYQESTVLGADGEAFIAGTLCNFRSWDADWKEVTTKGVKMRVWGAYITSGTSEFVNINVWKTIDSGVTIVSDYLFGYSEPALIARHIHPIRYDSVSDTFFMSTGDSVPGYDRNNIMQGTYNAGTDTIDWVALGTGAAGSIWENTGFGFDVSWFYLACEGTSATTKGIKRLLRTDLANIATLQERIFISDKWIGGCLSNNGDIVVQHAGFSDLISWSKDGINFITRSFPQFTLADTYGCYICKGYLDNGYYLFACLEDGETLDNYMKGSTLLIKPSVIN
jgi:hypothetical protein